MSKTDLSLLIPIYNEEECIEWVVLDLLKELQKKDYSYKLVLVNNGSFDKTGKIIESIKKRYPKFIKTIHIKKNGKMGGAVNKVMPMLNSRIIGFTCADGEVTAKDTIKLADYLIKNDDVELIKTIRLNRVDGYRKWVSLGFNIMVRLLFGIRTKDANGWPLLMRYNTFKKMQMKGYKYLFQFEYLYNIKKMKKKFLEVEVIHQRRKGGVSKVDFTLMIVFFFELIEYRIKTLFSR